VGGHIIIEGEYLDFRPLRFTDGENEEGEPDVDYLWEASP